MKTIKEILTESNGVLKLAVHNGVFHADDVLCVAMIKNKLKELGFTCAKPEGAFYMWVKSLEEDDSAFVAKAKEFNLLLVPGSAFMCPGYVRIAYCVDKSMIEHSFAAFEKLAESYAEKR